MAPLPAIPLFHRSTSHPPLTSGEPLSASPARPLAPHPTNNPLVHTLSDPFSSDPDRAVAYILEAPSRALTRPGRTPCSTLPEGVPCAHLKAFPHFARPPADIVGPGPPRRRQDRYSAAIATTSTPRAAAAAAPARPAAAAASPSTSPLRAPTCTHSV